MAYSLALLTLGILGCLTAAALWWPSISIGIFLSTSAVEQILVAGKLVRPGSALVNYAIGFVAVFSVVVALVRQRWPHIDGPLIVSYGTLLGLGWASLTWTLSPDAGSYALLHFSLKGTLAILLPWFVFRNVSDFRRLVPALLFLLAVVAAAVLLLKHQGSGARFGLVEGGNVLAPAKFLGVGVVLLLAGNNVVLRIPRFVRYTLLTFFLVALFIMGARAQFVFSVFVGLLASVFSGGSGRLAKEVIIFGILAVVAAGMFGLTSRVDTETLSFVAGRYEGGMLSSGLQVRIDNLLSCLESRSPFFGNGIMSWSYHRFGVDKYVYPHNAIAQLYFELGLVGLAAFLFVSVRPLILARAFYRARPRDPVFRGSIVLLAALLVFEILLAQKQGTFMNCLGVYLFGSMLMSYLFHYRGSDMTRGSGPSASSYGVRASIPAG